LYSQGDNYYWYKGKKIILNEVRGRAFILFDPGKDGNAAAMKLLDERGIVVNELDENLRNLCLISEKPSFADQKKWAILDAELMESLEPDWLNMTYKGSFYRTPRGHEVGLSHLFRVKLKQSDDYTRLSKVADENHVDILGWNKQFPLWYTLSCSKDKEENALEMAKLFYETHLFAAAEPILIGKFIPSCANDTYFGNQWGLSNSGIYGGNTNADINFCQVRNITCGCSSVIVAVIDNGVELDHPDLTNMHTISYDSETGTSPSDVYGEHGTTVAGIIGADGNNGLGITGIAPGSPIMSISSSMNEGIDAIGKLTDAVDFAWRNNASVINCSWYATVESEMLADALDSALYRGRNGLGCVVVFAAGNEDYPAANYPGNSNDDILVVGASSPCGERISLTSCEGEEWGSNYGLGLDVVAPGTLIPTTDRQGLVGYNPTFPIHIDAGGTLLDDDCPNPDYTLMFAGTSAAAPHVAGVAALILSVNPTLTGKQVVNLIESTAQKVGGYGYALSVGRPNGAWHNEMGYGLIDAYAPVWQEVSCPTTNLLNQSIITSTSVTGCHIYLEDIVVTNNASLVLNADRTTIEGPFEVVLGSSLEVE
jgi:hypothetical protein